MNQKIYLFAIAGLLFLSLSCNKTSVIQGEVVTQPSQIVSPFQIEGRFKIQNYWKSTGITSVGNAVASASNSGNIWIIESIKDSAGFYIQDSVSGNYIVQTSSTNMTLLSDYKQIQARWVFINSQTNLVDTIPNTTTIYRIMNISSYAFLNIESGPLTAGNVLPGWLSAMWILGN